MLISFAGTLAIFMICSTNQDTPANTATQGLWVLTRTASNAVASYKNGNATPFHSSSAASASVDSENFFALAENQAGIAGAFSSNQNSAIFISSGWDATQATNFATDLNTYMTSWGVNVF